MSKSKIKIATVTWISYKNFGTYLQAYALQHVLSKLGYDNYILSDQQIVNQMIKERRSSKCLRSIASHILFYIKQFFISQDINIAKIDMCYDAFAKKYLNIDYKWKSYEDLDNNYNAYICGSDQIWAPIVPFNSYYYLGFTSKPKIAYAPSIGTLSYPKEKVKLIKPLLEKFNALSIREEQGTEIIRNLFDLECQTVLDPTLLLDDVEWESLICRKQNSAEKFILCYLLTYNEIYLNKIKDFAKTKELPIKIFVTDKRIASYADIPLYVGPQEFITEIKNAEYFFTDSFHGTVFAIHFKKYFYTFKRFKDDANNNQNSRIINLFKILKIQNHFLGESELDLIDFSEEIDFFSVKSLLISERNKSILYLRNSLCNIDYD